jgi:hypothetical protein
VSGRVINSEPLLHALDEGRRREAEAIEKGAAMPDELSRV